MPFGRQLLSPSTVLPTRVSADGKPQYKAGGITIDWSTVAAAPVADTTLPDGSVIKANSTQYLRYGQVMTRIGLAEVQTVTYTGGPTAGSAILTLPAVGDQPAQSTAALAFNVSAADVQAALQGLTRIGAGGVTVGRTGAGSAGDPYIYTLTFSSARSDVPQLTSTHTFTGGTTPTTTHATTTAGGASAGKYGPHDTAATDGRQALLRGDCFVLDEIRLRYGASSALLSGEEDIIGGVFDGGAVWIDRVLHAGTGTASLAAGPTLANFLAAFPQISIYKD